MPTLAGGSSEPNAAEREPLLGRDADDNQSDASKNYASVEVHAVPLLDPEDDESVNRKPFSLLRRPRG